MNWFEVDKKGLEKQLARRGKSFVAFELIQNAWDQNVSMVTVTLEPVPARPLAVLTVEDNDPNGFSDLAHAYTLFAESEKKTDVNKRGRFNLGEKYVLALCESATIESTKGTIFFGPDGRKEYPRRKRPAGSVFSAVVRMTHAECDEVCQQVSTLIPPDGIETIFNGAPLRRRHEVWSFDAKLPTEVADEDGFLRAATRSTLVQLFEPFEGEPAMLYEMGIPVVETDDKWHVNVGMKVPLNTDRDNVRPSYLKTIRTHTLTQMSGRITADDATEPWVREALSNTNLGGRCPDEVVETAMNLRFGDRRVIYDPSDPEANNIATAKGYTVITGGSLSRNEWENVRRAGAALPAGQVTPSPKPFVEGGRELKLIDEDDWTEAMKLTVDYAKRIAFELMEEIKLSVQIADDKTWPVAACYGKGKLIINAAGVGRDWFNGLLAKINALLLHEFAHQYASNHLSEDYHEAICELGAELCNLALADPAFFDRPF